MIQIRYPATTGSLVAKGSEMNERTSGHRVLWHRGFRSGGFTVRPRRCVYWDGQIEAYSLRVPTGW